MLCISNTIIVGDAGNETFERLAAMGLLANFMVYLKKMYHMDQVSATSLMGLWTGVTSFLPLLGAFLSDAYIGRYWTIAIASIFSFLVPELNHSPPFLMALLLRILTQQILETGSRGFLAVKLNRLLRFLVFLRPFSLSTRSRSATQIKKRESEEEN